MSTTDTKVDELIINTLTKAQYDDLVANNQVEANQLYLTKDEDYYMQVDVTYGTTTYAQITSALGAKQEPVCNYNSYQYTYAGNDGTYYYFTCAINNEIKYIKVDTFNHWSNNSIILQTYMPTQDVSKYVVKPTSVVDADNTDLEIESNTIYRFTSKLTTLTLTSIETSDYESVIYFNTGSSITFVDNSGVKWCGDGSIPSLYTNTYYCIAIRNGLAEIDSFGSAIDTSQLIVSDNSILGLDYKEYLQKPTVVTTPDNTGLVISSNTIYKFSSALTSLTISSCENSDYESIIYFTTGSSITFVDNSNLIWTKTKIAPILEVNTIYCISICNNLAGIDSFGTVE